MLRVLVNEVDSMQQQMHNVSREMIILRRNQKVMVAMKNIATEMKNPFRRFITRLNIAEKRISELKNKTKKQR